MLQGKGTKTLTSEPELTCEEKLEAANSRIDELEQALRKEITFRTATDLKGKDLWLPVMDLIGIFHKAYQLRNNAVNNNKKHSKLIFTVTNEGKVADVNIKESEEDNP